MCGAAVVVPLTEALLVVVVMKMMIKVKASPLGGGMDAHT